MSEPPDLSKLAKTYVALWQDYLTAAANDPDLADACARMLAGMGASAALWSGLWQRPPAAERDGGEFRVAPRDAPVRRHESEDGPSRPAPVAAAPDERSDELVRLGRRLALIEERLAALEAGARQRGQGARGTARRRRS